MFFSIFWTEFSGVYQSFSEYERKLNWKIYFCSFCSGLDSPAASFSKSFTPQNKPLAQNWGRYIHDLERAIEQYVEELWRNQIVEELRRNRGTGSEESRVHDGIHPLGSNRVLSKKTEQLWNRGGIEEESFDSTIFSTFKKKSIHVIFLETFQPLVYWFILIF